MLYEVIVAQFIKMLNNLDSILAKGAAAADGKKVDFEVLLNSRLALDQFPLLKQIQIATDTAKLCVVRLTGKEAPTHDDKERTLSELRSRIKDVTNYLATIQSKDFAGAEEKKISQPRWEGKFLTGYEFAVQHALPNFYFHVTTAYAILRHNGVDIGKKDYLGPMPFKT
ncbi:MAG: DUF1993 domain-containing protein [Bdellovibrionales bacterium]|nr:DUF1993 domain-containing protein [Bdellovibrionales bacterium]